MISIRPARAEDLPDVQGCNVTCLPENYTLKYYYYHYINWPALLYVAEDTERGKVVGYVLASVAEEEGGEARGHITSLSVLRDFRRLGLAQKLMVLTHRAMKSTHQLKTVTLHVRVSNHAAIGLYRDRLGYEVVEVDAGYYADGEDALLMKKVL